MIRNEASVLNMNGGTIIFKIVNQINDIHTVSEWMFYEALCKYVCVLVRCSDVFVSV